jgi:hypothetical protein
MRIPVIVARQRLGQHFPAAMNTRNSRIVGDVVFYAVLVVSKESRCLVPPRTFYLEVVAVLNGNLYKAECLTAIYF